MKEFFQTITPMISLRSLWVGGMRVVDKNLKSWLGFLGDANLRLEICQGFIESNIHQCLGARDSECMC